jgi:hypothetical protein
MLGVFLKKPMDSSLSNSATSPVCIALLFSREAIVPARENRVLVFLQQSSLGSGQQEVTTVAFTE